MQIRAFERARTITCARLFILLALIGAGSGCAVNPVTGQQDFVLMSEQQELAAGRQANQQVLRQYQIYPDQQLQTYVTNVGQKLAGKSHRAGLTYHFTVLEGTEINAFALPGGYVYITRGLLGYLNSEAELAAVLGHEIGHVTARHGVEGVTGIAKVATDGGSRTIRIGALILGSHGYIVSGIARTVEQQGQFDDTFKNVAKSFHRLTDRERARARKASARGHAQRDDFVGGAGAKFTLGEASRNATAIAERRA